MTIAELLIGFGIQLDKTSFSSAMSALESLKAAALRLASISFAKNLIEGAADTGKHLVAMSKQLGLTVEAVQDWAYVSKQSGSNLNEFAVGVSQLERNLRAVHEGGGGKAVKRALAELGFTAKDVTDALASPEGLNSAILKISDKFNAMGDGPERASLALVLFGRRAKGIVGDLSQGSAALQEQMAHFRSLGGELSGTQVNSLKTLGMTITDLKVAFQGLANQAIAALAPLLEGLLHVVTWLALAMNPLIDASQWLANHWALLIAGALGLATAFIALKAEAIAAAVESLIAWAAAAAPFLLIGVIIAALILIVNDLWVGFHGGRSVLFDLWHSMMEWAQQSDSALAKVLRTLQAIIDKAEWAIKKIRQVLNSEDPTQADVPSAEERGAQLELNDKQKFAANKVKGASGVFEISPFAPFDRGNYVNGKFDPVGTGYDANAQEPDWRYSTAGSPLGAIGERKSAHDARVSGDVHTTIHTGDIHVHTNASDPKAVAEHVKKGVTDALQGTANALAAGVRGGKVHQ